MKKIHYQCSNCGKQFSTSLIYGVPQGMYLSGVRAVGDAVYCEACTETWKDRNGKKFDEMYEKSLEMFKKWWNYKIEKL